MPLTRVPWLTTAVLAGALTACAARENPSREAARRAIEEESIRARAQAFLRTKFPEVEGELTREAITQALLAAPAGALGTARNEALAALQRGEDARAYELLGALLADAQAARAKELWAARDARGALAVLDRAVVLAPESGELRVLRAEAACAVGALDEETALVEQGLDDFVAGGLRLPGPRAWLGASRAALALGRSDEALEHARRAVAEMRGRSVREAARSNVERAWSDAALAVRARGASTPELARETIAALESAVGRAPEDPRAWRELGSAYESVARDDDALTLARNAISHFEDDAELHELFARRVEAAFGRSVLVAEYERYAERHPACAHAPWHQARAAFDEALETLAMQRDARVAFERAQAYFERTRSLDATRAESCRGFEALAATGIGWSALAAGDGDAAQRAFLSVEDRAKGGAARALDTRLRSALDGLETLARQAARAAQDPDSRVAIANLERASKLYDYLHAYTPLDRALARATGALRRDAAIAVRIDAVRAASSGRRDEAERARTRSIELMEGAARAFTAALAPDGTRETAGDPSRDAGANARPASADRTTPLDDARTRGALGAVYVRYLQREPQTARLHLESALAALEAERAALERALDGAVGEDAQRSARARLDEVAGEIGDVCQDLGQLHLTLDGDARLARAWFERAAAAGPDRRSAIEGKGGWLERCDAVLAGRRDAKIRPDERWDAPPTAPRNP